MGFLFIKGGDKLVWIVTCNKLRRSIWPTRNYRDDRELLEDDNVEGGGVVSH
jgi:hypothetical protein